MQQELLCAIVNFKLIEKSTSIMGENLINHVYWDIPNIQLSIRYNQLAALITNQLRMCNIKLQNHKEFNFNYVRKSHKPRLLGYTEHQTITAYSTNQQILLTN